MAARKQREPGARKRGPAPPSPELVARILVDADTLGDRYAAKRHKVGERTVQMWRERYGAAPNVAEICDRLRQRLNDGFLDKAKAARARLVELVLEGAEAPRAALRDKTEALRRVSEIVTAHEVLNSDDDDLRDDDHQSGDREEAEGEG